MTLQSSGAISLADLQTEFGGANPIGINEYYAGGSYVPSGTAGIPTSGTISLSQFYGKSSAFYQGVNFNTNWSGVQWFNFGGYNIPKKSAINWSLTFNQYEASEFHLAAILQVSYDNVNWYTSTTFGICWYNCDPHFRSQSLYGSGSSGISGSILYVRIGVWTERAYVNVSGSFYSS